MRHPNYLGEIIWWWSISILALVAPQNSVEKEFVGINRLLMIVGPIIYTFVMIYFENLRNEVSIRKGIVKPRSFAQFLDGTEKGNYTKEE